MKKAHERSHHGHAGAARHSPRNGFNGFLRALLGDRACLPPSPRGNNFPRNLTPASGRQDHTTSPSASWRSRQSAARVHRIPCPTSVTIAKRPFEVGRDGYVIMLLLPNREANYFFKRGWTEQRVICPT